MIPVPKAAVQEDQPAVLTNRDEHVGWVVLNRPAKRNALNTTMRSALDRALGEFGADDDIRIVVITGSPPAFCAGADLTDGQPAAGAVTPDVRHHPLADGASPVARSLATFRKPLIAAINGPAMGGGLELALACDVRVAASSAMFGLPEVRIGSLPGSGGTQRLVRAMHPAVAARMLLSGEPISAEEALRTGLISDLVEPDQLGGFTADLARRIAANAPLSLRAMRQCLLAAREAPLSTGLELERALWIALATTHDRQEGRAAFRERRSPRFSGN
ncbi:MAG: enoyl-CoA hydratase/isomerase family protein [Streptosporangiaceae bacterium]